MLFYGRVRQCRSSRTCVFRHRFSRPIVAGTPWAKPSQRCVDSTDEGVRAHNALAESLLTSTLMNRKLLGLDGNSISDRQVDAIASGLSKVHSVRVVPPAKPDLSKTNAAESKVIYGKIREAASHAGISVAPFAEMKEAVRSGSCGTEASVFGNLNHEQKVPSSVRPHLVLMHAFYDTKSSTLSPTIRRCPRTFCNDILDEGKRLDYVSVRRQTRWWHC